MSRLRIFHQDRPQEPLTATDDGVEIGRLLSEVGVRFERWSAAQALPPGASQEQVLASYQVELNRLQAEGGYTTFDVVSMHPEHPQKQAFREKFLREHRHSEDEVRFFVDGAGLFTLHIDTQEFEARGQNDDRSSGPAKPPHWFDMGTEPSFSAIRLFKDPAGWVADYTGSDIADSFARFPATA